MSKMPKVDRAESRKAEKKKISLRPIGAYPPACMPYGQEAAPVGGQRLEQVTLRSVPALCQESG